jgi:hypothetical protein
MDGLAEIRRGDSANRLINDPLMVEAFTVIEAEYIAAWKATPVRDTEARERIWAHLQALGKVKGHLESVIETGKLAKKQSDEIHGKRRFF